MRKQRKAGKEQDALKREEQDAQKRDKPGEIWEVALSPFATGAELAKCHSRRTTKKYGSGDDNATRSADHRKQS